MQETRGESGYENIKNSDNYRISSKQIKKRERNKSFLIFQKCLESFYYSDFGCFFYLN